LNRLEINRNSYCLGQLDTLKLHDRNLKRKTRSKTKYQTVPKTVILTESQRISYNTNEQIIREKCPHFKIIPKSSDDQADDRITRKVTVDQNKVKKHDLNS
jgi:hypothetical protein